LNKDFDDYSRCLASKCTSVEDRPLNDEKAHVGVVMGAEEEEVEPFVRYARYSIACLDALLGYNEGNGNVVEGKKEGEVPVEIPAALLFMRYLKNYRFHERERGVLKSKSITIFVYIMCYGRSCTCHLSCNALVQRICKAEGPMLLGTADSGWHFERSRELGSWG